MTYVTCKLHVPAYSWHTWRCKTHILISIRFHMELKWIRRYLMFLLNHIKYRSNLHAYVYNKVWGSLCRVNQCPWVIVVVDSSGWLWWIRAAETLSISSISTIIWKAGYKTLFYLIFCTIHYSCVLRYINQIQIRMNIVLTKCEAERVFWWW